MFGGFQNFRVGNFPKMGVDIFMAMGTWVVETWPKAQNETAFQDRRTLWVVTSKRESDGQT